MFRRNRNADDLEGMVRAELRLMLIVLANSEGIDKLSNSELLMRLAEEL